MHFHAVITKGPFSTLLAFERQSLNCFLNDKTNYLPMVLELVVSMSIMCTKNNSRPKEVANGTLRHVVGYQLPNDATSSHEVIDESTSYMVSVSSTLFDIGFVKLLRQEEIVDLELPPNIVGIHHVLEHNVAIQLPN